MYLDLVRTAETNGSPQPEYLTNPHQESPPCPQGSMPSTEERRIIIIYTKTKPNVLGLQRVVEVDRKSEDSPNAQTVSN